jgi:hypothetical protein
MNKKWWIIGGLIVVGAGVGAYFLFRPSKEEREKKKLAKGKDSDDKSDSNSLGETTPKDNVNEAQVTSNAYNSRPRETYPDTPFKNSTEGNVFRKWINDTYPDYAKAIDLDPSGSHNNAYIRKAWQKYGTEFEKQASDKAKEESGIKTIEITKAFQDAQKKWNKSTSINTSGNPYFALNFKPLYKPNNSHGVYVYSGEKSGECKGKVYVYNSWNNKAPVGNGRVMWALYWKGTMYAQGTGNPALTDIKVTYKKAGGNLPSFTNVDSVGKTFGQILNWDNTQNNIRLSWC